MIEPIEKRAVYSVLSKIDVSKYVEKKGKLSYLSWSHAWGILLAKFPDSTYKVYENKDEYNYFHDGKFAWVKTGVIVDGIEMIEYLPIMDFRNQSIPVEKVNSMDANKAIQRSLTKCIARHGLGLNIYSGEDLPMGNEEPPVIEPKVNKSELQKDFMYLFDEKFSDEQIDWAGGKKSILYINQNIDKVPVKALILAINLLKRLTK